MRSQKRVEAGPPYLRPLHQRRLASDLVQRLLLILRPHFARAGGQASTIRHRRRMDRLLGSMFLRKRMSWVSTRCIRQTRGTLQTVQSAQVGSKAYRHLVLRATCTQYLSPRAASEAWRRLLHLRRFRLHRMVRCPSLNIFQHLPRLQALYRLHLPVRVRRSCHWMRRRRRREAGRRKRRRKRRLYVSRVALVGSHSRKAASAEGGTLAIEISVSSFASPASYSRLAVVAYERCPNYISLIAPAMPTAAMYIAYSYYGCRRLFCVGENLSWVEYIYQYTVCK